MANKNKKIAKTELTTVSLSVLKENGNSGDAMNAVEASQRFLQAAALLPEKELLGWQLCTEKDAPYRMSAFYSAGAGVTPQDLDWIFAGFAKAGPQEPACALKKSRRVYALRPAGAASEEEYISIDDLRVPVWDEDEDEEYSRNVYIQHMHFLRELEKAGGTLWVLAGRGREEKRGSILIGLPDKMTLRLRAALSLAFPGAKAAALDPQEPLWTGRGRLSAQCLYEGLTKLLDTVLFLNAKRSGRASGGPDEDAPDGGGNDRSGNEKGESDKDGGNDKGSGGNSKDTGENDKGSGENGTSAGDAGDQGGGDGILPDEATIEELDLSVRSFNCLKRAGIHTLGQLRGMTGEDLMKVRNMNRKFAEEVLEKLNAATSPDSSRPNLPSGLEQLDALIGLGEVKAQVRRIAAFAKLRQEMAQQNKAVEPLVLNMEFLGSPGTAKTTVARIIAQIFREVGLLPRGGLVEVGRADLVARYVGQTADQVKAIFNRARGRVLFIDEAYSLADAHTGSFGDEAINTIVQEMENHRADTVVIFAGYPDEMEQFFARNPGLRSRVPFQIRFEDYSAGELAQIARLEAGRRGFSIHSKAQQKLAELCQEAAGHPELGNGRFSRNLVESAILRYAERVYGPASAAGETGAAGETDAAGGTGAAGETGAAEQAEKPARDFALQAEDLCLPKSLQLPNRPAVIGFRGR